MCWRLVQESPTGAVDVIGEEVVVAGAQEIRFINVNTGVLNRTIHVALDPTDVLQFVNPLDSQRLLVSWFTTTDVSYVLRRGHR